MARTVSFHNKLVALTVDKNDVIHEASWFDKNDIIQGMSGQVGCQLTKKVNKAEELTYL